MRTFDCNELQSDFIGPYKANEVFSVESTLQLLSKVPKGIDAYILGLIRLHKF